MGDSDKPPQAEMQSPASQETGATQGYPGFEFQLRVSVWVALVLLFEEECTESIELEPASQEDIEADVHVHTPEGTSLQRLVIQIKSRTRKNWKVHDFLEVLQGSSETGKSRRSAWQRLLEEPGHRYILITDAAVADRLQGFRISRLLAQPQHPELPKKLVTPKDQNRNALASRIGIIDQHDNERLSVKVQGLLSERLFVPFTTRAECEARLLEQARGRLLNHLPRRWGRTEILKTVESFGGNPLGSPELRDFVPPRHYADIQARLEGNHAVLLQGPPGAGKTQLLAKLEHEYRTRKEPFAVRTPKEPGELRAALQERGCLFIEVEDPWGAYQLRPNSDLWAKDLPKLLKLARADKKLIVTTRETILQEVSADARHAFSRFAISVTYEDYDSEARQRILFNKLRDAAPWQRDLATACKQRILDTLVAPISIDRFAEKLKELTTYSDFDPEAMLKDSAVEHLAPRFIDELRNIFRDTLPAAISLWGLLSLSQGLTFQQEDVSNWQQLRRQSAREPLLWKKLVGWMTAGRWLQQETTQYRVHSTTVEGLARIIREEPEHAATVLDALLSDLIAARRLDDAFRLALHLQTAEFEILPAYRERLREHIQAQLVTEDSPRFHDWFAQAMRWLNDNSPVARLVDGIVNSQSRRTTRWYRVGSFIPPRWTDEQRAEVAESKEARKVTSHYIRWSLPFSYDDYEGDLARWLWSLGWDLSEDFEKAVENGLAARDKSGTSEAVHGALMAPAPAYDELFGALLRAWDEESQRDEASYGPIRRKAKQQMLDELDADIWMEPSPKFIYLNDALEAAVFQRRRQQGYHWLLEHPRREDLLGCWAQALTEQLPRRHHSRLDDEEDTRLKKTRLQPQVPVALEELRAFYRSCLPDGTWALGNLFNAALVPELIPELLDTLAAGEPRHMHLCLQALCPMTTTEGFREHLSAALAPASDSRCAGLLFLAHRMELDDQRDATAAQALSAILTETIQCPAMPLFIACVEMDDKGSLSPETLTRIDGVERSPLLVWITELEMGLGRAALVVLAKLGEDVTTEALAALQSPCTEIRIAAVRALTWIRGGHARSGLLSALRDEHYECRLLAARALAPGADSTERQRIISLAQDGSAPVREACVDAIREGRWVEGLDALCGLLSDSRNARYGDRHRNVDHHVAFAAARALTAFSPLPSGVLQKLMDFIRQGLTANVDLRVHRHILQFLAPLPLPGLPAALVALLQALALSPGEGDDTRRLLGQPAGVNREVIKLRYLAVRALVEHFVHQPESRKCVDPELLRDLSSQPDAPIAQLARSGLTLLSGQS